MLSSIVSILLKIFCCLSKISTFFLSIPEFNSKKETAKIAPIPPEIIPNNIPKKTSLNLKILRINFFRKINIVEIKFLAIENNVEEKILINKNGALIKFFNNDEIKTNELFKAF